MPLEGARAAVVLHDCPCDHEPEAGARDRAAGGRRRPVEAGEQLADLLVRDADSGVGDLEAKRAVAVARRQCHRAAGRRELERVRDEVVEHLAEPVGVGLERQRAVDVEHELDSLLGGGRPGRFDCRCRQLREVGFHRIELEPVGLDLRDEQEVLHDAL